MSQLVPPNNPEAEKSVLGAVLMVAGEGTGHMISSLLAVEGLRPEHFYSPRNGGIFAAIVALHDRQEPTDPLTVCAELERDGKVSQDDRAYVNSLPAQVPFLGNFAKYAKVVIADARFRVNLEAGRKLQEAAAGRNEEAIVEAEQSLAASDGGTTRITLDERRHQLWEYAERGTIDAYPWPFKKLDQLTSGGIRDSQLTVLGGWGSHGKSVFLDMVLETAKPYGARTALYINEMSVTERDLRFASRQGDISFHRLMQAKFNDGERERYVKAIEKLPFEIIEAAGQSAHDIAHDIRRQGFDVVGIDLLNGIPHRETADIDENVRTLANCARQAKAHIIAAQHLNAARHVGTYPPEPVRRDLRGSSAIADLADNVLFVYRKEDEGSPGEMGNESVLKFDKVKNGIQGRESVIFQGKRMRFLPESTKVAA